MLEKLKCHLLLSELKLSCTHTENITKGMRERGKKRDDNGFFIYFGAVEMSHKVCIWNWVTGVF